MLKRGGAGGGGVGLRDLGLQELDLLEGGSEIGGVALDRRVGAGVARLRLLRVLHAAIAGCGEIGVALVLLLREGLCGSVDIDGRLCCGDHRILNIELRLLARDRRLRGGDIGLGLVERDAEVAIVDPGQHLACLHMLVIADQNPVEIAADLRRDGGVVGLHIGVIGGDEEAPDGPVIVAIPAGPRESGDRYTREQELAKAKLLAAGRGRCGGQETLRRRGRNHSGLSLGRGGVHGHGRLPELGNLTISKIGLALG